MIVLLSHNDVDEALSIFNQADPFIKFTSEVECNNVSTFFDVKIQRWIIETV